MASQFLPHLLFLAGSLVMALCLDCPESYTLHPEGQTCLREIAQSISHAQAWKQCKSSGGDLAKVPGPDTENFLKKLSTTKNFHWIGLHKWKGQPFKWVDKTLMTYSNWRHGQPQPGHMCVVMDTRNRKWSSKKCSKRKKYPAFCETAPVQSKAPPIKDCPDGWQQATPGSLCLRLVETPHLTWQGARDHCRNLGGDLVAIPDQAAMDDVKGVMGHSRYWIGLHDPRHDGSFLWLDQTEKTSFTAWKNAHTNELGNEYCVELIGGMGGLWNDKPCNALRGAICMK